MKQIKAEIKDKQKIINLLKDVLLWPRISEVVISSSPRESKPEYKLYPWPRFAIPLRGLFWFRYYHDGVKEKILQPGQILFCAKYGMMAPFMDKDCNILSISFLADFTRYLITAYSAQEDCSHLEWYHTSSPVRLTGTHLLQCLQNRYYSEYQSEMDKLLMQALIYLSLDELQDDRATPEGSKAFATYQLIKSHINENIHKPLSRKLTAREIGLNPSHLSKLFKRFSKEKFNDYIQSIRMARAVELMNDQTLSIKHLADFCGFKNVTHFNKVFRRTYGTAPGKYRNTAITGNLET